MSKLCKELYDEIKDSKIGKMYSLVYFLRRILICVIVTFWYTWQFKREFLSLFLQILLWVVHLLSAIYIFMRPFKKVKDNIIEWLDDSILFILSITFVIWNQDNMWSSTLAQVIVYILTANSVLINIVLFIDIIVHCAKWCCKKHKTERVKSYSEQKNKSKPDTSRKLNDNLPNKNSIEVNNQKFYPQIISEEEKQGVATSTIKPHFPAISQFSDNSEISGNVINTILYSNWDKISEIK